MARNSVHSVQDILNVAEQNRVPLEHIRFFIGQDYRGARAFGIYQDPNTQEWVVYKNKDDGSRAERYRGFDEEFAAQEIWEKLESEIIKREQKYNGALGPSADSSGAIKNYTPRPVVTRSTKQEIGSVISTGLIILIVVVLLISAIKDFRGKRHNGYYRNNDSTYYYQDGDWYFFDDTDDYWVPYYGVEDEDAWFDDYYQGRSYDMGDGGVYFNDSGYYDSSSDSSFWDSDDDGGSFWDSDSDWGSWDSGDTDWGSDW